VRRFHSHLPTLPGWSSRLALHCAVEEP